MKEILKLSGFYSYSDIKKEIQIRNKLIIHPRPHPLYQVIEESIKSNTQKAY